MTNQHLLEEATEDCWLQWVLASLFLFSHASRGFWRSSLITHSGPGSSRQARQGASRALPQPRVRRHQLGHRKPRKRSFSAVGDEWAHALAGRCSSALRTTRVSFAASPVNTARPITHRPAAIDHASYCTCALFSLACPLIENRNSLLR